MRESALCGAGSQWAKDDPSAVFALKNSASGTDDDDDDDDDDDTQTSVGSSAEVS